MPRLGCGPKARKKGHRGRPWTEWGDLAALQNNWKRHKTPLGKDVEPVVRTEAFMSRERSRQRKLQRRSQKRREQLRRISAQAGLPPGAARDLEEAESLIAEGDYDQAIPLLKELWRRYPRRVEILICLADAHRRANDLWSYQATCEKIVAVAPDAPELWLALGSAAISNTQIVTALRAFGHVADSWPDHPEAGHAQQMQESLREMLEEELRRRGLEGESGFRVMQLHDAINLHLHCGHYDKVCDTAARLLAICPTFAPALNNRSEAHFQSARYDEAIADSRRVLQFDPINYHALSNLTRYLYLSGQFEEALTTASVLKRCDTFESDAFVKKAETFAILGDWEAVHQVVIDGQCVWAALGGVPALAEHLKGVALANFGNLKEARQHWRRAAASLTWAEENLKDSKRSRGERHGPWAYPLEHWAPRGMIEKLLEGVESTHPDSDVTRLVQRHFERYPQLELLAEAMLQRSDPNACELLIRLAPLVKRPAIFAALHKFALSQRGSDDLRLQALMAISKAGYIEGQVEFWREGSLRPISLISQEIHFESTTQVLPEINYLMNSARAALNDGRSADAERLLDKALNLRPDDLTAQYNRAMALALQGYEDRAIEIVRQIHRAHPDYLFARTHLAAECVANGELEQAQTLLAPITQKKRLHISEYAAWCSANIQLAIAKKDLKTARGLLHAWEQLDPDDKRLEILKRRIEGENGMISHLSRLLFKAPKYKV